MRPLKVYEVFDALSRADGNSQIIVSQNMEAGGTRETFVIINFSGYDKGPYGNVDFLCRSNSPYFDDGWTIAEIQKELSFRQAGATVWARLPISGQREPVAVYAYDIDDNYHITFFIDYPPSEW